MWILNKRLKGYIFYFCTIVLGLNFFLTPRGIIPRGVSFFDTKIREKETKNENILTCWSVTQAGSNYEKKWGSEISLDCPFNLRTK